MNYAVKMMSYVLQMMSFLLQMIDFVLNMMSYVFKMLNSARTQAHAAGISCLDLQADTLVSCSWDGGIKVWKLRRGRAGSGTCSSAGCFVYTCRRLIGPLSLISGTIRLELSMDLPAGHDAEVTCVAIATKTKTGKITYSMRTTIHVQHDSQSQ